MDETCESASYSPIRRQAARLVRDPKRKGELAEMAFVLTAANHGLAVCKPYGDSYAYDFIVEIDGRLLRLQVKAAFTGHHSAYYFRLLGPRGQQARRHFYGKTEIDFLAAYIGPNDIWYILPVCAIQATMLALSPGAQGKQCGARFEIYREAWHLITDPK
jgi:hypothetical protein